MRKQKWTCREIDCEGEPCGKPFTVSHVRDVDAGEAAESAAAELDDREDPDFDSWVVGDRNGQVRTVEVEEAPGVWRRFTVRAGIKVEYAATEAPRTATEV